MPAARQAALMLAAPLVKLIMAGTRPMACRAKNVTATPAEFGSITPTAPPTGRQMLELGAQHLRAEHQLAVGELGAERILSAGWPVSRVARASTSAANSVRSKRAVLDGRVDHDVLQRQRPRPAGAPCP